MPDHSPVPSYPDRLRLDGKGFIVVGAGQGMGRQSAHALASVGAKVVCVDIVDVLAVQVAEEVGGIPWVGDVTRREEVERLVTHAEAALGRIDGFVDIVGMARWGGVLDIDDETWNFEFDICLRHAYLLGQIAGRRMRLTGGGSMVFIASVSGLTAAPNHAAYGAAKAGLMAWVKSLAVELGPHSVRANAIAPGSILTPRIEAQLSQAQIDASVALTPLRRPGVPPDIASVALFLSSDLASFITGQTLIVDGGVTAKFPYETL
ncbi:MAG: family oxidoreductase [Deltaproteobacteria bacterium]|nr:family oxidoreductase [Deltaproteobacteria bacterium]